MSQCRVNDTLLMHLVLPLFPRVASTLCTVNFIYMKLQNFMTQ